MNIITLQLKTELSFEYNLKKLTTVLKKSPANSLTLAPELLLSGYSYDDMQKAVDITKQAVEMLKELSRDKTIGLTLMTKKDGKFYNTFHLFSNQKLVHTQSKVKLFSLNDEAKFFTSGNEEDIKIIEINGIKIATVICFELRFLKLWERLKGADIILIPSMWGRPRKENFNTLTKAIAVMNQCFVVASNSANSDMAKSSGIITPFGVEYRDDRKERISFDANLNEITKMRRYMDVGLDRSRRELTLNS